MFKAIDATTDQPIICLDNEGDIWLDALRRKGRDDLLRCQTCKEAVLVKSGELRRTHFAHKALGNCPSQNESPELLEARAVLYQWLRSKFKEGVTLEKQIDSPGLARPFDCWTEYQGRAFAYWLVEKRMKSGELEAVEIAASTSKASLTWIFLSTMLRRLEERPIYVTLSTTERSRIARSDFDAVYPGRTGGSLHYLDAEAKALLTFRGLECRHAPQVYHGHEIRTPLDSLLISPDTGEFVHPGEHEELTEHRQEIEQRQEEERRVAAERRRTADEERQQIAQLEQAISRYSPPSVPRATTTPTTSTYSNERSATCVDCGQLTPDADCVVIYGQSGQGLCRGCSRKRDEEAAGRPGG